MTVDARAYRPPFVTQRGIDSTLDECAFCSTLVNLACATSGEITTNRFGREMGKAQLHYFVRRMRRLIDDFEGGITIAQRKELCVALGYPQPRDIDLRIGEVLSKLKARTHTFSVSTNPGNIVGPSPVKRCACAHEWALVAARGDKADAEILVYDPLRNAGPRQRGEWVPARVVMQAAFKNDERQLVLLLQYTRGAWTKAKLDTADKDRTIDRLRTQRNEAVKENKVLTEQLSECREDGCAAATESLLDALHDWEMEQRL